MNLYSFIYAITILLLYVFTRESICIEAKNVGSIEISILYHGHDYVTTGNDSNVNITSWSTENFMSSDIMRLSSSNSNTIADIDMSINQIYNALQHTYLSSYTLWYHSIMSSSKSQSAGLQVYNPITEKYDTVKILNFSFINLGSLTTHARC